MNSIIKSQFRSGPAWKAPETSSETLGAKSVLFLFRPDCFCTGTSLVLALHLALFVYSLAFHLLVVFIWTLNAGIKCQPQVFSSLCAAARWDLWRVCGFLVVSIISFLFNTILPMGFSLKLCNWCDASVWFWYSFWICHVCELKVNPACKAAQIDTNHIFHSI